MITYSVVINQQPDGILDVIISSPPSEATKLEIGFAGAFKDIVELVIEKVAHETGRRPIKLNWN